jgi:hypothetical protein
MGPVVAQVPGVNGGCPPMSDLNTQYTKIKMQNTESFCMSLGECAKHTANESCSNDASYPVKESMSDYKGTPTIIN